MELLNDPEYVIFSEALELREIISLEVFGGVNIDGEVFLDGL